jgi:hypothetical protein
VSTLVHFPGTAHTYDRLAEAAVVARETPAQCPIEGCRAQLLQLYLLIHCQNASLRFYAVVLGVLVSFSVRGNKRVDEAVMWANEYEYGFEVRGA